MAMLWTTVPRSSAAIILGGRSSRPRGFARPPGRHADTAEDALVDGGLFATESACRPRPRPGPAVAQVSDSLAMAVSQAGRPLQTVSCIMHTHEIDCIYRPPSPLLTTATCASRKEQLSSHTNRTNGRHGHGVRASLLASPKNRTPLGGVGHTDVNGGPLRWAGNRGAGAEATRAGATRVARTDSGPNRDIQIGVGVYPQLDRL
jgi:hypothetical protein